MNRVVLTRLVFRDGAYRPEINIFIPTLKTVRHAFPSTAELPSDSMLCTVLCAPTAAQEQSITDNSELLFVDTATPTQLSDFITARNVSVLRANRIGLSDNPVIALKKWIKSRPNELKNFMLLDDRGAIGPGIPASFTVSSQKLVNLRSNKGIIDQSVRDFAVGASKRIGYIDAKARQPWQDKAALSSALRIFAEENDYTKIGIVSDYCFVGASGKANLEMVEGMRPINRAGSIVYMRLDTSSADIDKHVQDNILFARKYHRPVYAVIDPIVDDQLKFAELLEMIKEFCDGCLITGQVDYDPSGGWGKTMLEFVNAHDSFRVIANAAFWEKWKRQFQGMNHGGPSS